jgi:hypothetical protein
MCPADFITDSQLAAPAEDYAGVDGCSTASGTVLAHLIFRQIQIDAF